MANFLFGLIHWDFAASPLFSPTQLAGIAMRTVGGLIIALVYLKGRNIYGAMLLHMLVNTI